MPQNFRLSKIFMFTLVRIWNFLKILALCCAWDVGASGWSSASATAAGSTGRLGQPDRLQGAREKAKQKEKKRPKRTKPASPKGQILPLFPPFCGISYFFLTNKHTPEKRRNFDKIRENAPTRIRNEGKIQLKKIGCSIIKLFPGMGNAQQRLGNEELLNAAQGKLKLLWIFFIYFYEIGIFDFNPLRQRHLKWPSSTSFW